MPMGITARLVDALSSVKFTIAIIMRFDLFFLHIHDSLLNFVLRREMVGKSYVGFLISRYLKVPFLIAIRLICAESLSHAI